jgi:hypothetical protein
VGDGGPAVPGVGIDQLGIHVVGVLVALADVVEQAGRPDHVEVGLGAVEVPLDRRRFDRDLRHAADVLDVRDLVDVPGVGDVVDVPPAAALESERPGLDDAIAKVAVADSVELGEGVSNLRLVVWSGYRVTSFRTVLRLCPRSRAIFRILSLSTK